MAYNPPSLDNVTLFVGAERTRIPAPNIEASTLTLFIRMPTELDELTDFPFSGDLDLEDLIEFLESHGIDVGSDLSAQDVLDWVERLADEIGADVDVRDLLRMVERLDDVVSSDLDIQDLLELIERIEDRIGAGMSLSDILRLIESLAEDFGSDLSVFTIMVLIDNLLDGAEVGSGLTVDEDIIVQLFGPEAARLGTTALHRAGASSMGRTSPVSIKRTKKGQL